MRLSDSLRRLTLHARSPSRADFLDLDAGSGGSSPSAGPAFSSPSRRRAQWSPLGRAGSSPAIVMLADGSVLMVAPGTLAAEVLATHGGLLLSAFPCDALRPDSSLEAGKTYFMEGAPAHDRARGKGPPHGLHRRGASSVEPSRSAEERAALASPVSALQRPLSPLSPSPSCVSPLPHSPAPHSPAPHSPFPLSPAPLSPVPHAPAPHAPHSQSPRTLAPLALPTYVAAPLSPAPQDCAPLSPAPQYCAPLSPPNWGPPGIGGSMTDPGDWQPGTLQRKGKSNLCLPRIDEQRPNGGPGARWSTPVADPGPVPVLPGTPGETRQVVCECCLARQANVDFRVSPPSARMAVCSPGADSSGVKSWGHRSPQTLYTTDVQVKLKRANSQPIRAMNSDRGLYPSSLSLEK